MKVALIGLGMVADTHVAALRDAGLDLCAVMGRDLEKTRSFSTRHGDPNPCTTIEEVIATTPDFVILATPPDARLAYVRQLCAAKLPILMEKPIERDVARARAIVELCEAAKVPLGVTLQHRMRPAARQLCGALPELGQIATVDLRVPWWRDQSYYEAPGRGTFDRDGGGVLITQAIHQIDLMLQLCGPVTEVFALTTTSALHDLEAEDFATASLRFKNGAVGSIMASVTHYPGHSETLTINGTTGSAALTADHLTLHLHGQNAQTFGQSGGSGGGADPMAFSHAWHQAAIADFAQAIASEKPPAITGRSALAAQALIDAMQLSARTRRPVTPEATDA
jgi:predicted dehydrogenase